MERIHNCTLVAPSLVRLLSNLKRRVFCAIPNIGLVGLTLNLRTETALAVFDSWREFLYPVPISLKEPDARTFSVRKFEVLDHIHRYIQLKYRTPRLLYSQSIGA